jgi:ZIP family zinc transporter
MGAIAGFTIFLGLPIAKLRGLPRGAQGFLNAAATGILVFLLWDILAHAAEPVSASILPARTGGLGRLAGYGIVFMGGLALGLLALALFNSHLAGRRKAGADGSAAGLAPISPRNLSLAIATGLGLHNLSEGLAIGESAAAGSIAFALVLVIGFALHNITEGFGIAAPMAADRETPSWGFLALTGLVGGGPTFLGTAIGYVLRSPYLSIFFLTLAAGALIYVLSELFVVCRRLSSPAGMASGVLAGFMLAWGTDLYLSFVGT